METIPFYIEVVGLIAAVLTTSSFVPQVYKIWKTKSVESISFTMYLFFFTGVMLWLVYGIYLHSIAMTVANIVTGSLTAVILCLKVKYR